jgi:hypothetical protein
MVQNSSRQARTRTGKLCSLISVSIDLGCEVSVTFCGEYSRAFPVWGKNPCCGRFFLDHYSKLQTVTMITLLDDPPDSVKNHCYMGEG